jgi:hypothetical protein
MFSNCESLTSLDVSKFNFRQNELSDTIYFRSDDLFVNCKSLTSIDITTVNKVSNNYFDGLPTQGTIKYNRELKKLVDSKHFLPKWTWILV